MTKKQIGLCRKLQQMGFTQGSWIRLYGQEFELVTEPIAMGDDLVLVDAIEKKSGQFRRVRIPLSLVRVANANEESSAA